MHLGPASACAASVALAAGMGSEAAGTGSEALGMSSEAAGMGSEALGTGSEAARLLEAVDFAARKHKEQRRKDPEGTPYINHPIGAEPPGTASRSRETPAAPLSQRTAHPGTPPAPARCQPPGAPRPGPGTQLCPLSRAVSFGPMAAELPKHGSPGPGSRCACRPPVALRCVGPAGAAEGPPCRSRTCQAWGQPHLGGTASPWDLPACPAEDPARRTCPRGVPCPGLASGKPRCPPCGAAPVSRRGAACSPPPPATFPFSLQPWPGSWRMRPA
ncbi:guanosine-3',5'-bis(diphosphate) 3'-pyrophosphohydrolase MESH1 isoform X1 [Camarhynchus parvulus]|uniref:guanosine-3',5'-bis(diphosphate) 3'-pyrophosphohydrolase MESH1 isoform X1 n=1 Tax=Geospiza parvula TaxID=87175 RepID=UPI001237DEE2|nr:guanosine-3',5'-bis(diphosphate) 3'-pyrophosphohydrolase MESH1 isoform X1 [Camarhynchus parvulus]